MICHTDYAPRQFRPAACDRLLRPFGEYHHIRNGAGTVDMEAHPRSTGPMEQGKPFSTTQSPLVDFDAVCQKVRAAIEPARAHAISLHDSGRRALAERKHDGAGRA